ncbi:MAG: hypothetical protein HWE12_02560 [Oceanospirillaceae bacterium]|nr:hypothetical protein [Oceanospirillaceae bacterium]
MISRLIRFKKYIKEQLDYISFKRALNQKKLVLTLNGGFGDVVLSVQFIKAIKEKNRDLKVTVYYRDNLMESSPENYSWGKTRHFLKTDGSRVNPIKEWLEACHVADEIIGADIDSHTYGYRMYPEVMSRKFFGYLSPEAYRDRILKNVLYFDNMSIAARRKYTSSIKNNKLNIAIHLRRNSEKIIEIAKILQKKYDPTFIVLGSTEHQVVPDLTELTNKVILLDSYKQGISTLDVLTISTSCSLFIGGRGGFELVHWLAGTPSICVFDDMGFKEIEQGWWDPALWTNNSINQLFRDSDPNTLIVDKVSAYITEYIN